MAYFKDTKDVLKKVSQLRLYDGKEKEFWDEYLHSIAFLSKSAISVVVIVKENEYSIKDYYIADDKYESLKDKVFNSSSDLIKRSSDNIYAFEKFIDDKFINYYIVAINLDSENEDRVLLLLVEGNNKSDFNNIILRCSLCRDVPLQYDILNSEDYNSNFDLSVATDTSSQYVAIGESERYFESILSILDVINYETKFKLACMKLVDEIANRFELGDVSIGWQTNDYIKAIAIAKVEHFQNSTHKVKSLEAIFEESCAQDEEIFFPEDKDSILVTHAHNIYFEENRVDAIYTFPIRVNDMTIGVVSFSKKEGFCTPKELEVVRLTLNFVAPILNKIYEDDQNFFKKIYTHTRKNAISFLGPDNTTKKLIVVLIMLVSMFVVFGKMEYRVEAVVNVQTNNIAFISAPFEGIVKDVYKQSGDHVKKDEILATLDIQELSLKELETTSEIVKYSAEVEKARAAGSLADMKISLAKKEQSIANLKKVKYYLSQSKLKSPFDGIIVEGDKEKIMGSPFLKGDIVFQIANPVGLYINIKVLEEYIDEIKLGQTAQINLVGRPDEYFDVRVDKIVPVANVDDVNGNVFLLKAVFLTPTQDWMRPGMSGVAKISIEDRSIFWILTHKLSDYLHLNIWW
jgi:hypothetical protein